MENSLNNHKERLRQRYINDGLNGFHNYEVLELMLSYSIVRQDTKALSKRLLSAFGNLMNVLNASVEELSQIEGISNRSAVLLKLFRDAPNYYLREVLTDRVQISSCYDVHEYLKQCYKGLKNEEFKAIYLNSRNIIIREETLFHGTVNEAKIYIRNLIEKVIKYGATSIIIAHNHPGGTLEASPEDVAITEKIKKILSLINVRLLDHVIVGDNDFISLAQEKKI